MHGWTLASSHDSDCELYQGTDATLMFRGIRAWMFREQDAPVMGWEAHAETDTFYRETGLVLVANASKRKVEEAGQPAAPVAPPLQHALAAFAKSIRDLASAEEDFVAAYGRDDKSALLQHLSEVNRPPSAGYREGYLATLVALKANEAALGCRRIELEPGWFELD
jgi:hypothetical protein